MPSRPSWKHTVDVVSESASTPEVAIPPLVIPVPSVGPSVSSVSNTATNDQRSTKSSDLHVEKDTAVHTTLATTMTTPGILDIIVLLWKGSNLLGNCELLNGLIFFVLLYIEGRKCRVLWLVHVSFVVYFTSFVLTL